MIALSQANISDSAALRSHNGLAQHAGRLHRIGFLDQLEHPMWAFSASTSLYPLVNMTGRPG
jgi:hypothetical protein